MEKVSHKLLPQFKVLFVLVDGLGDNGIKELDMKTTLQKESLPHFNALAEGGLNGLHDPVQSGLACGSDTAHMSMFGYDPFKLYNGRGSYESLGSGISMEYGEIAFKSNFAYMNDSTGIVEKRRVDRHFDKWGLEICKDLNNVIIPGYEKDYKITVLHATEHRCGIKISGPNLSSEITGTDPIVDGKPLLKVEPLDKTNMNAVLTADIVNKVSDAIRERLNKNPENVKRKEAKLAYTNVVLLRGCGSKLKVPSFEENHHMKPFMIAPTAVIAGIGMTFGMDIKIAKGATGYYDSNYTSKADVAIENLKKPEYQFGFLHIKGVDDAGHDGSFKIKIELLKKIDEMLGKLIKELREHEVATNHETKYILLLTGDHTTPVIYKEHSFEPVPVVISTVANAYFTFTKHDASALDPIDKALALLKDGVVRFSEIDACNGSLGRFQGREMMNLVKNFKAACIKSITDGK